MLCHFNMVSWLHSPWYAQILYLNTLSATRVHTQNRLWTVFPKFCAISSCLNIYFLLLNPYQVCELDIIFNFEKAYFILDEFLMGGEIQETSKKSAVKAIEDADMLQEVRWGEETRKGETRKETFPLFVSCAAQRFWFIVLAISQHKII